MQYPLDHHLILLPYQFLLGLGLAKLDYRQFLLIRIMIALPSIYFLHFLGQTFILKVAGIE
jgi:hypothetical protein